jgi:hypothetical protein
MAYEGDRSDITLLVTNGVAGTPAKGYIVKADASNSGNAIIAGANAIPLIGVTLAACDADGYCAIRTRGIVQIVVGGSTVTVGDKVGSDSAGKATTITPLGSFGAAKGVIGTALTTATTGNLVDVLIDKETIIG